MSDYLLVHGAAQGAWAWGKVWGHMTAPEEHPPRLYRPRQSMRVHAIDLPGHGSDTDPDVALVDIYEGARAISDTVVREQLRDVVLVGHSLGGTLALQAATDLTPSPRKIVLVAGLVPPNRQSASTAYPLQPRVMLRMQRTLGSLLGRDFDIPISAIKRYWCRGLDPRDQVSVIGHFSGMPVRMLTQPISLDLDTLPCPVTYVVLTADRLISPARQRAMAARIPDVNVVELDASHQAAIHRPRELAEIILAA